MKSRTIFLRSGKWRCYLEVNRTGDQYVEFVDAANPENRMTVRVGYSLTEPTDDELTSLARDPLLRLWADADGVLWRVAAVGPGTPYEYPLRERYLVFDSRDTWAGIVRFDDDAQLGELTGDELRALRDAVHDFGGRRRSYRPPESAEEHAAERGDEPAARAAEDAAPAEERRAASQPGETMLRVEPTVAADAARAAELPADAPIRVEPTAEAEPPNGLIAEEVPMPDAAPGADPAARGPES